MVLDFGNKNGICKPKGFTASGVHAGLKKAKKDIAVIYSEKPSKAAGVFTTNVVKAAPVLINMEHLQKNAGNARAIVVNSAVANACTGNKGMQDAEKMAALGGKFLKVNQEEVLVASTGVIGVTLPMEKIEDGIEKACRALEKNGSSSAAEAIMTTDTVPKEASVEIDIEGTTVSLGGIAKGSGMIHPNMATMLCFVTTDADISAELLNEALKEVVDKTFNMISVDGDTSTNDMVLVLANGEAKNPCIKEKNAAYKKFRDALYEISKVLSKKVVEDGEGATKIFEVEVMNALTIGDARKAARSVTESSLVKTAIFGEDANWGRILAAVGYSGAEFDPEKIDVYLESSRGKEQMMKSGMGLKFDEEKALEILKEKEIYIKVDLNSGPCSAKAWGCDFSFDYVKINAEYRS
jgi:glutamate N-acetyltransferase/amino-acid N-acetyltransferase